MDVKKFFADLIATFRKPADPPPSAPVVDVDAAHEAGRNAGYEADRSDEDEASGTAGHEDDHAERHEVGRQTENAGSHEERYETDRQKDSDEGAQIGLEANTPPEPPPPLLEQPSQPEPPAEEPQSS
ncbi:hypothetical protein QEV83_03815 [Methylocapsa sp. D3K7]|uniref:hypothetical protein n=1 Tax=Methylocapsa sp. D3K7 TaxID=3041435 RepID=UPI00244E9B4B|nr:hypothetical protein [Methylocapsa sp. D3K7]WGJ15419.1 hypothetical protein QEV83_03815 [Methylocapsa sp. D3K7]